jgi:6-phosphogluconolactonase (cycloisomerase 2 family)
MRRFRFLCLLAAVLGAGPARAAGYVYVHDYGVALAGGVNQVFGFSLGRNGSLEPLEGSPFLGPGAAATADNFFAGRCPTLVYARRARLLLTSGPGGVTAWSVAKDGSLEVVSGSPFGEPSRYFGVAVAEVKRESFVYAVDQLHDELYGFRIEDDGSLAELPGVSPVELEELPLAAVAHKRLLAVLSYGDNQLASFRIEDDGSLQPAPGSPLSIGDAVSYTLDLDGAGRHLYTGDLDSGNAFLFEVDPRSGALEPGSANPADTDLANTGLGYAVRRGPRAFALSIQGELQTLRRKRGELHSAAAPAPLGFAPAAHALAPGRRLLAAASNVELRTFHLGGGGARELDAAPLAASNVNAVLVVER